MSSRIAASAPALSSTPEPPPSTGRLAGWPGGGRASAADADRATRGAAMTGAPPGGLERKAAAWRFAASSSAFWINSGTERSRFRLSLSSAFTSLSVKTSSRTGLYMLETGHSRDAPGAANSPENREPLLHEAQIGYISSQISFSDSRTHL